MGNFFMHEDVSKYELVDNYRSKNNIVAFANQWAKTIQNRLKRTPGYPVDESNGRIEIVQYKSDQLITPLVEAVKNAEFAGSTCILTKTNEEAAQVTGSLIQNGIRAKLIQTNDGFRLSDLYELRYFSDQLNANPESPIISDETWEDAIQKLSSHVSQSNKLQLVTHVYKEFESVNPVKKYKSDWKAFVMESKIEDFINIDSETIFVSTIHKAKGKEFDNVFILLNNFNVSSDENKRQLYVAMTRAKDNLNFHYNGNYLQLINADDLSRKIDSKEYEEPRQIAFLLTHKEVYLGYFEFVQHRFKNLQSGSSLTVLEDGLGNERKEIVLKYSQDFKKKLNGKMQIGYVLKSAKINFFVYWKGDDGEKEVRIILPEITMVR